MLETQGLSKTYPGGVEAMRGIDLSIGSGVFGLLGPNGAGKTTLMRTLATLQLPDQGSATLSGLDLLAQPRQARRRIGYLPQEMGVYPRVTGREMLSYIAGLKGVFTGKTLHRAVSEQLEKVNLLDVADRRVDTYSGGMRQRFGIAAAFLGKPELVIVDEPTAGLDPSERRRFQYMLSEAAQDCVLLLSSHIVEDIAGMCERMAIMDQGQIILTGDPHQLVQDLHGKVWELETSLDRLDFYQRTGQVLAWRPHRGRLVVRLWSEQRPALDAGVEVVPVDPDLEDLYAMRIRRSAA
ncbi:MAG: ATP-binding cassette domain-containing protein [Phycisphaerales bacterium JB063]